MLNLACGDIAGHETDAWMQAQGNLQAYKAYKNLINKILYNSQKSFLTIVKKGFLAFCHKYKEGFWANQYFKHRKGILMHGV